MFRSITLTFVAIHLSAQNIPSGQNQQLSRAAKNPYDLARFIDSHLSFDCNVIWKALGAEPLSFQPCGNPSERKHCSTELITVLDPDQIILAIHGDISQFDVYLRFLQEKTGRWHFTGTHEAFIHNHPRRHEVDRSIGKPFLRISSQGLRGSDVDSEIEEWFDLTQPGFEPVFSFPVQGSQERPGFAISRRIFGIIISKNDQISVTLEVRFSAGLGEHDLGRSLYEAVYTRTSGKQLILQTAYADLGRQSKMPVAEFEALADLDEGPSDQDLMHYTMPGLKELATGRDVSGKDWLKQFLTTISDTPEVRELKTLLR